jgi:hypothetical protein
VPEPKTKKKIFEQWRNKAVGKKIAKDDNTRTLRTSDLEKSKEKEQALHMKSKNQFFLL